MASLGPPVVYHKFPDHSPEIQNAIWKWSLPTPRIIQVHFHRDGTLFFSNASPPAALHVCFNSRKEALTAYTPCFETGPAFSYSNSKGPRRPIYVDLSRDILYVIGNPVKPHYRLHMLSTIYEDAKKVQSVAVDLLDDTVSDLYDKICPKLGTPVLDGLTTLWIIVQRENYKFPLDFRTGAHLEFRELRAASVDRAVDSQAEGLEEWEAWNRSKAGGNSVCLSGTSPKVRFVEIKLVIHAPAYSV